MKTVYDSIIEDYCRDGRHSETVVSLLSRRCRWCGFTWNYIQRQMTIEANAVERALSRAAPAPPANKVAAR